MCFPAQSLVVVGCNWTFMLHVHLQVPVSRRFYVKVCAFLKPSAVPSGIAVRHFLPRARHLLLPHQDRCDLTFFPTVPQLEAIREELRVRCDVMEKDLRETQAKNEELQRLADETRRLRVSG